MKYLKHINESNDELSHYLELIEDCFIEMECTISERKETMSTQAGMRTYEIISVILPLEDGCFASSVNLSGSVEKLTKVLKYNLELVEGLVTQCIEKVQIEIPDVKYTLAYDRGGFEMKFMFDRGPAKPRLLPMDPD